jgi:hypothetical protein
MKHIVATTALAAALGVLGAGAAQAGIGDGIASANVASDRIAPVENAQFIFGGQNYCWYDSGWQGPGWYWCGYAWRTGFGWGGGDGFHGWSHRGRNFGNYNRGPMHPGNTYTHRFNGPKGPAMGGPKGPMMGGPKGPMGGPKGGSPGGKKWP